MKKDIAIIIPVWNCNMTIYEKISLSQCLSILDDNIFCLVTFKGVGADCFFLKNHEIKQKYKAVYFDKRNFSCINAYSKLLVSLKFYLRFIQYKYILIYQLDCFVFRNEINKWISLDYSYVGAPWFDGYNTTTCGSKIIGVGNGGFSLRCVKDHLRVLLSFKMIKNKANYSGNTFFLFNKFQGNEDIFWSEIAGENFSWFKIPDWKTAAKFSVEVQPRYFFELNNGVLPFGCHAWWRYDLPFWKPHIEKFGYKITE